MCVKVLGQVFSSSNRLESLRCFIISIISISNINNSLIFNTLLIV